MTYASLERLKAFTQVDPGDLALSDEEFDDLCQTLLGAAKDQIDAYTGRQRWGFDLHEEETLDLDGKNGDRKMLNLPSPVHEVHSVEEDGTLLTEGDAYEWKPHGSLVRTGTAARGRRSYGTGGSVSYGSGKPPGLQSKQKAVWSAGYNNVEVTLTFGYHPHPDAPDSWSSEEWSVPRDVVKAEMKLADHELQGLLAKRESTTVQVDDFTVELQTPISMTEEVKQDLEQHRDRRGGG